MTVTLVRDIQVEEYRGQGSNGVKIQKLINSPQAPNFAMRRFIIQKAGYTPHHSHNYEHEVFVLSGKGSVSEDGEEKDLKEGAVVYIQPNVKHQFKNIGEEAFVMLCLVPV